MRQHPMILTHPVDCLRLDDLDTSTLDMLNPPPLFLGEGSAKTQYMPALMVIDVVEKVWFQKPEKGEFRFLCSLSRQANDIWLRFFIRYHPGASVTLQGNRLMLCCQPQVRPKRYAEVCEDTVYWATHDYWKERGTLLWLVFTKMKKLEWRHHWEGQIKAELANYQQTYQEGILSAENKVGSPPFTIWNLPWRYRSMLEVKFGWWRRVLDAPTIRKYRALFGLDPVSS